jgi:hypothetical protein
LAHHAASGSHHHKEECAQKFGKQTPPFLSRVIEVGYPLDNVLFVSSDRAKGG